MPKGINADGSPKKRPAGSGKKEKPHKIKGPYRLALDVATILETLPEGITATEYIEDAVRLKYSSTQEIKELPI